MSFALTSCRSAFRLVRSAVREVSAGVPVEKEGTYYRATANPRVTTGPLTQEIDADVCVVGGGFAGINTALALTERSDMKVVLLESKEIGHGASGRNGGFCFGGFSLGERGLVRQLGRERARSLYAHTLSAVELIRQRVNKYSIQCDRKEAGVILANWFDDDSILLDTQKFMRDEMGTNWEFISRADCSDLLRTRRYFGGLMERHAFHFHPLNYARGIAAAAESKGARVYEQSPVTALEDRPQPGGVFVVRTAGGGAVRAREVVVCCGGYIERMFPKISRAILPIATYVMSTEPLGERARDAIRTDAAVYDTRFAFDYYRMLADTRLLWGGRISILDRTPAQVARLLYADMLKVFPQLAGVRIEHAWSGLMGYPRHKMPQLGRLPNGVWHNIGFGGHGVAPTTMGGELLARAIVEGPQALGDFVRYGLRVGTWASLAPSSTTGT